MTISSPPDVALRTISDDGSFRILVASTVHTVSGVLDAQNPDERCRNLVPDLVSASVLLRLTMSPDYRLQAILQHSKAGSIVGDSHPDGTTRGLLRRPLDIPFEMGSSTLFSVHRALYGGELHQGIVETSEGQTMADVVTGYLGQSEQISSVVGLMHRYDDEILVAAGGYIVQLLPGADDPTLALMTARLEQMPSTAELFGQYDDDPSRVAKELFGPIGYHELGTDEFFYGCTCSRKRVLNALSALSNEEIDEVAEDDDIIIVDCDYCNSVHRIKATELRR